MKHVMQLTDSARNSTPTLPLFVTPAELESWEREPFDCFKAWLSTQKVSPDSAQKISPESAQIYLFMWGKFARWKGDQGLSFAQIRAGHIDQFLNESKLEKHHRYRYVRLIERVYQHLSFGNPGLGNPGSLAARQRVGEGRNDPMAFLRGDQREALIQWISRDISGETYARKDGIWKEKRDLAITAVMLGGGAKVGEARALSVSCISDDGAWLTVKGVGEPDHKTCLLPFARAVMQQWIETRRSLGVPGDWVFVAGGDGRPMNTVTIWRRVQRVMKRAGVGMDAREGPQTLRNTFAGILVDLEIPDGVAAAYLGLRDAGSFDRLRGRLEDARQAQNNPA